MAAKRVAMLALLILLLLAGSLITAFAVAGPGSSSGGQRVEIMMTASQFQYSPGRIVIHQGDHVVIRIRATDVAHGFYLDGYGINREIMPGEEVVIEFTATMQGKFAYRCSFTCGTYHPYMKGELVVESPSGNLPFYGTIFLTIGVAAGMIVYVHGKGN